LPLQKRLIDVQPIYLEPAIEDYARGREILAAFPDAERIPVDSHWKIPSLHGNEGSVDDWLKIKRTILVLGVKKSLSMRPNGRSAHLIAPSSSLDINDQTISSRAPLSFKRQYLMRFGAEI